MSAANYKPDYDYGITVLLLCILGALAVFL